MIFIIEIEYAMNVKVKVDLSSSFTKLLPVVGAGGKKQMITKKVIFSC